MSEKSELSYLLDALEDGKYPGSLSYYIHRAIELRKQDLAKADAALLYTNREKLYMDTPQNVPNTADNTPKGGGALTDAEHSELYEICRGHSTRAYSLVRRLVAHGLIPDPPLDPQPKGGGDVPDLDPEALSKAAGDDSQTRIDRIVKGDTLGPQTEFVAAFLCGAKYRYRAISARNDALLAERDALRERIAQLEGALRWAVGTEDLRDWAIYASKEVAVTIEGIANDVARSALAAGKGDG